MITQENTVYLASYDIESVRCLKGLRPILEYHREHRVPATLFVVGELLEDRAWASEFQDMTCDPLFNVQSHTYSHLLLKTGDEGTAEDFKILEDELERTKSLIENLTKEKVLGFRTPRGFADGLKGEGEILRILWQQGIRFVSSKVMGPGNTVPSPLAEPFFYFEEDILRPLLEIPAHDWHDNVLKGYNCCPVSWPPVLPWGYPDGPPATPEEEFAVYKKGIDYCVLHSFPCYAPIFHPWSVYRFNREARTIGLLLDYLAERMIPVVSYLDMYRYMDEQ